LQLLDGLVGRIADAVDGLESEIDAAEGDTAASYEQQSRLSELRRRCAGMRRHLSPQRDALDRVAREGGFGITEADGWMIREAGDQMVRALEDLDLARERTMVAHEQLQARLAQEQNSRIYLLSIVAAIFLPLSYLTGIFGMNVAGLPGVENPLGFAMVSGLMLILAIGLLVVFRFKRWL
jgi:zinc transporter